MKKKWKLPITIPGYEKNDPMAELEMEEAVVRAPQFGPGWANLPDDEKVNAVWSVVSNAAQVNQNKKDLLKNQAEQQATASPQQEVKPRDNMTSPGPQIIIQTQPSTAAAPRSPVNQPDMMQMLARRISAQPGVATMPTNVNDLRSAIYGTRPVPSAPQASFPEQDPDALMQMIADRFRGRLRR